MNADDETQYLQGYNKARRNPVDARQDLGRAELSPAFKSGIRDALAGRPIAEQYSGAAPAAMRQPPAAPGAAPAAGSPGVGGVYLPPPVSDPNQQPAKRAYQLPVREAPAYNPNLPPGRAQVLPGNNQFYEVVARLPLIGPIPYDEAVQIERLPGQGLALTVLKGLVTFEVLGGDPQDWTSGGYRLSGPNGAIARRVGDLIRARIVSSPASLGLPFWFGAKTTRGIRLLGPAELQALGLL